MATNGSSTHAEQYQPDSAATTTASTTSEQSNANLGKDEVAWFFVEQYYTTLSKTPEKLHRSQFVYGQEGQSANVSVGRQTIQDRIKDLDFQNCKVRVSNVDSQASFDNIVIQVIGETSNKGSDPKKFVQTFVLAQQPAGYFVLNDILRYIDEEGDEELAEGAEEAEPAVEAQAPGAVAEEVKEPVPAKEQPAAEEPASLDPAVVDEKLEEVAAQEPASVNEEVAPEPALEAATEAETTGSAVEETDKEAAQPEKATQKPAEEAPKEVEKPHEPSPTPVAARKPPAQAPAPAPVAPPKPMTWASRAAAAAGGPPKVNPAMPLAKAPVPVPTRPAAAAPAASQTTAPAAPAPQATETTGAAAPAKEAGTEWQTAGGDSKRQNRPQSISGPPAEKEGTLGYVKYVTDKVLREDLEAALAQYGELAYFDINRQKNCAFVEFKTPAGYQAAVAANPHVVNGESIIVEPRRPKAGAYGGGFNAGRPMQNRGGRGGFDGNRSGSHGGRGSFGGQNRGRGGLPRGRGASQAANA
ncbi:hypothetical protein F5Y17DRAFT_301735 [Xylariaceae sp. FL0594]|nr:hypothetical protein F5Y17DRAFT_301735 [Xylariaceae sp. FL0594]